MERVAAVAPKATAYAAPFTGFFLDHANLKRAAGNYTSKMEYIYTMQNLSFGTDGALTAACERVHPNNPGLCFMSPHMARFIKTPFYMCVIDSPLFFLWFSVSFSLPLPLSFSLSVSPSVSVSLPPSLPPSLPLLFSVFRSRSLGCS
jgi:hypothetical protein